MRIEAEERDPEIYTPSLAALAEEHLTSLRLELDAIVITNRPATLVA